jgi:hypothetical protein
MYGTHWASLEQARTWGQQRIDSHSPHAVLPIGHPASLPGAGLGPDAPATAPEPAPNPPDEAEPEVSLPELTPLPEPVPLPDASLPEPPLPEPATWPLEDPLPAPPLPVVPLPQATANADAAKKRHGCIAFDKAIRIVDMARWYPLHEEAAKRADAEGRMFACVDGGRSVRRSLLLRGHGDVPEGHVELHGQEPRERIVASTKARHQESHGILEATVAFIQKPIAPERLGLKVREVLDGI